MTTLGTQPGKYRKFYRAEFHKLKNDGEERAIPCDLFAERLVARRNSIGLSTDQVRALAYEADKNKDSKITLEEFEELCISHQAQASSIRRAMYTIADTVITPKQRVEVHSYLGEYNCCPPPVFILIVSIVQLITFLYYYYTHPAQNHDVTTYCAGCYVDGKIGPFMFVPQRREEAWRFLTYQFLHAGLLHLMGNLVMQLLVGIPLEVVHKMWRIAPLYLLAVVSGSLLQYTIDPRVYLVGASAGVYALILAHLANVFINWSEMPFRWLRLLIVGVWITFDVGGTIFRRFYEDNCDRVSHAAHIAGGITGFCFGVFILYNVVEHTWEKVVKWICAGLYIAFIGVTVTMAIVREPTAKPLWDTDCASNQ